MKTLRSAVYASGLVSLMALEPVLASDPTVNIRFSAGSSWQARNDVQIPYTDLGTRFSLEDAVGAGPVPFARLEVHWKINEQHGLRLLLAPLSYTEAVTFNEPVEFSGESFSANQSTDASYRFNSWRLGYHYTLLDNATSSVRIGATLKVRDAEIRLSQGDTESSDDDVGLVPLLYLAGDYRLNKRWTIRADLDGLAGGPGRAIDLGAALEFSVNERWRVGTELRVLDGGADTDEVYNFAQFNSASFVISAGF